VKADQANQANPFVQNKAKEDQAIQANLSVRNEVKADQQIQQIQQISKSSKFRHMKFNWGTGIFTFLILFIATLAFVLYKSRQYHNSLVMNNYYELDLEIKRLLY